MSVEIKGRLLRVLDVRTGIGKIGEWKNQDFVIETQEQYPRQICIALWGDKIDMIKNFSIGDLLKVSADIESREYNEKWYTSVKAWQVEKQETNMPNAAINTLPDFPPPEIADTPPAEGEFDDLPF
jgi:hypothetical protein